MAKSLSAVAVFLVLVLVLLFNSTTAVTTNDDHREYARNLSYFERLAQITAERNHVTNRTSSLCQQHMQLYWDGLQQNEPWATQMYDSNGRYSSQLLFGNNFWLGSLSLCDEITQAPFNVSFKVAKTKLSIPQMKPTLVSIGICHPSSCTEADTANILAETWSEKENNTILTVLNIRQVPGAYSVLKDTTFQTISGIIIVVSLIVLLSTTYEYVYEAKKNRNKRTKTDFNVGQNNKGFEMDEKIKIDSVSTQNSAGSKDVVLETEGGQNKSKENFNEKYPERSTEEKTSCENRRKELFLAFSALKNGKQILSMSSQSESAITSIHGLRVFSLFWVILVHTYLQFFAVGGNKGIREVTERSFMFRTIGNATFSVDTFFFISGLLLTYLYANKEMNATKKHSPVKDTIEFVTLIAYRFIRLTPVYLLVIGIIQKSMAYLINNSVFEPNILDHYTCKHYWWRNIIYLNNFYPRAEMCGIWTWYLAADTQFFTFGSLLLVIGKRRIKLAGGLICGVLVAAWSTTAFISYTNQYSARLSQPFGAFDELYDKPWTRIGPFIIGMFSGYFISRKGDEIQLNKISVIIGWILSLAGLMALVYGLGESLDTVVSALYVSLGHTLWGVCLAWIVFACHTGRGGVINSLLSHSALLPLSRLTYCAYLIHPVIMVLTSYVMDGSFHIHNGLIVIIFLGNTVAAFMLSFLLSLGFEAPVVRIVKLFMK